MPHPPHDAAEGLCPIWIASKARPHGKTMQLLTTAGVPFTVVVEPQDVAAYAPLGYALQTLPANDQGLPYVRRWILQQASAGWFWMLDDDISAFYLTQHGKAVKVDALTALRQSQRYFVASPTVAQAALEYQQFAWRARQPYVWNSYCDVCVAIHRDRTQLLTFRESCGLKVDRDFTLQVLGAGFDTLRVTQYSFAAPKNGSNAGGLAPLYARVGEEARASQELARLWPGICQPRTKADGRPDVAINWRYFAQQKKAHRYE